MKVVSILVSILACAVIAHAEENDMATSNVISVDTTVEGTQTAKIEEPTFGKANSTWNFNLGMSQFSRGSEDAEFLKGSGLSFEVQKRFADIFYLGAGYTSYNTSYRTQTYYGMDNSPLYTNESYLDVVNVSLEAHVIRMPLPGRSEFFAAVDVGGMLPGPQIQSGNYVIYPGIVFGAGVGVNISNQIGIRADIKTNRDFRAFNSVSLVGYY